MFEGTSFGKTVDLLKRSMDVAVLRRNVIADNIANSGVPDFKRSTVNFATADPRHSRTPDPADWRGVEPRRVLDYLSTSKNNGNNVDPEQEIMDSVQNQLMYTLMAQAANFEFGQINLLLR
jgi:flagellar basal-body rod protein FlgB